MKVYRVLREENHETNLVTKLATSMVVEMLRGVLVKMAEVPYTERMLIYNIKERKD